jgi:hypothetical protein
MEKRIANKILTNLEYAATELEGLAKNGQINPRLAAQLVNDIDSFSDKFEVSVFGVDSFKNRQAKVLQMDKDEVYMHTFDNPNKVIIVDKDEAYMHTAPGGYRSDAIGTFDVDRSATVVDRQESAVHDLSPFADKTKQQPSWTSGPVKTASAKPEKHWAP